MNLDKHAQKFIRECYGVDDFNDFSGSISQLNEVHRARLNPYLNYHQYMKSAVWQLRRDLYMEHYQDTCQECNKQRKPLQLHHLTYDRLGVENLDDIKLICKRCHFRVEFDKYEQGYHE